MRCCRYLSMSGANERDVPSLDSNLVSLTVRALSVSGCRSSSEGGI